MTEKLYLQDAYAATFSAHIVERVLMPAGRLAVVLDHTAFYPGTSGLPADRGWLNRAPVIDIIVREDDEILHVLSEEIWEDQVHAQIKWPRRLDAMRQHTAGHLLAHALTQVSGAATLGITVTEQAAWLELGRPDVSPAQVEQAESAANEIVLSNRAVRIASVDAAQAGKIGLAVPAGAVWPLQVVSVEGTGVTACQGVHVAQTGEMGLVKVLGCEARGERLRVQFACGSRALAEFRQAEQTLALVAANLGVAAANVAPVVTRLTSEWSAARTELETLRSQIVGFEAEALVASAEAANGVRVIRRVYHERDVAEVRQLASLVVAQPGLVALLGTAGSRAQLVFARSADVGQDMTVIVRAAVRMLNAQGGGQPALAESLPVRADEARVEAAIAKAAKLLTARR